MSFLQPTISHTRAAKKPPQMVVQMRSKIPLPIHQKNEGLQSSSTHLLICIIYLFYNNIIIMIIDPILRTVFPSIFFCQMIRVFGEHVLHLEMLLAIGNMFVNEI